MTDSVNKTIPKQVIRRQLEGEVVSKKSEKTIHVLVRTNKMNMKYRKQYATSKKYAVHDEKNTAKEGDVVLFSESRPISKTKKWRLVKVLKSAV